MNAGRVKTAIFGIALGIIAIVAYIVFKVKKDVIDKMMSNYDRIINKVQIYERRNNEK